ncbi:hypothetical protein RHSIM_Rhsim07G0165000 [Rhododendron simsii]|uniref:Uncharacterized protein n=1 Tax=Rhododendron simsii TaxID=118357 RepID=A0A834LJH5_RHOSS|nr:hypothetical protein RHSIM_Rhsim07G0165000 [Rhododendron simsii]
MEHDGDNAGEAPTGGDGTAVRGTEPGAVIVPIGAEEIGLTLGEGLVAIVEGGSDGEAMVTPMDSTEAIEGFLIITSSVGDATVAVAQNIGDTLMEECRMVEDESRTVEVSVGRGDIVMGEHRTIEGEHPAGTPVTPASVPFTAAGSVIEMEIGGLDVSVERRAMEERRTPASATPPEFPFTPSDTPIETESKGAEDEDTEAVARRLARGKSIVGESDGQEARDPLAAPLFRPPIGSSREQGVSLPDTLECANPRDLSARLAEVPSLASVLASEEVLQEAEREEEKRQRAREGPRVTLVQEVEAAARERATFREASYVPRVPFFVPFGVDAFVPRQSLQEEQVLHDPGSHMGMSGLGVMAYTWVGCQRFTILSRRGGLTLEGLLWLLVLLFRECVAPGWHNFRWLLESSRDLGFRGIGDVWAGEYVWESSSASPSIEDVWRRGALGGNESEAATGSSGSRGSRRGGASSLRRSVRGRGTRRVAEMGHTFPEVSKVVSVVTREGIEGEIAIPSRSASITLPEAEVPRAWAKNVYRLLLDCFTVIRQGAMGVSPKILPCGATVAAQRGGARQRCSSGGPTSREGGREESSSQGSGRGEATSRGRGVWVIRQPRGGAIHRPRTKNARSSPPPAESTPTSGRVLREKHIVKGSALASLKGLRDAFPKHTWRARVTIPRDPYPSVLLPQDMKTGLFKMWRQELDGMRSDLRHNFAYAPR